MNIKFVKVERACQHNKNARKDAAEGHQAAKIIYDYEVIDSGEKTAIFKKWLPGTLRYQLCDITGAEIKETYEPTKSQFRGPIYADTQKDFESVYLRSKVGGFIPTQEQIDARIAAKAKKEEEQRLAELEQQRIRRIQDAGPQLLEFLKNSLAWIDSVPMDAVLPAMPGFDRDEVNDLIDGLEA